MDRITEEDLKNMFVNPFYAITIAPVMALEHEPMVSEDLWVKANLKVMKEIGEEAWLRHLLKALKAESAPTELSDEEIENL